MPSHTRTFDFLEKLQMSALSRSEILLRSIYENVLAEEKLISIVILRM